MKITKWIISIILIIVGICIILYPEVSNSLSKRNQTEIIKKYREDVLNIDNEEIDLQYKKAKEYNEEIDGNFINNIDDYINILNLSNDGIMSYLEIPKISVRLPIYHGTTDDVMKKGVGHIKNTSLPIGGENTHCVLTGHTGLSRAEIFTRLNELEVNDYFYINTLNEQLIYKVYQIKVVLPTELEDLKIIEGKDLVTLITCTPYGINTHRLLVQGERTEENKKNTQEVKEKVDKNNKKIIYFIIILIIIFYCILLNKIVKYRKRK